MGDAHNNAIQKVRASLRKYPLSWAFLVFIFGYAPQWVQAVFGLFSSDPLIPWLTKRGIKMPPFLITWIPWITAPISVFLIWQIYLEAKKAKKLETAVHKIDSTSTSPAMPPSTLPVTAPQGLVAAPSKQSQKSLAFIQGVLIFFGTLCAVSPFLHWRGPAGEVGPQSEGVYQGPTSIRLLFGGAPGLTEVINSENIFRWYALETVQFVIFTNKPPEQLKTWTVFLTFDKEVDPGMSSFHIINDIPSKPITEVKDFGARSAVVAIMGDIPSGTLTFYVDAKPRK